MGAPPPPNPPRVDLGAPADPQLLGQLGPWTQMCTSPVGQHVDPGAVQASQLGTTVKGSQPGPPSTSAPQTLLAGHDAPQLPQLRSLLKLTKQPLSHAVRPCGQSLTHIALVAEPLLPGAQFGVGL